MRWLVVLALLLVAASATAADAVVHVQGQGATPNEAKLNGFRTAIEREVGSLIITQTETRNNKLVRDDILNYSSGYVVAHEILGTETVDGEVHVDMYVKVASSKIAQRLLVSKEVDRKINGANLSAQITTLLEERHNGDQILSELLGDYPRNTFMIKTGEGELAFDNNRVPYIIVPYEIAWSQLYLEALAEAMRATNPQSNKCNGLMRLVTNGLIEGNHADIVKQKASDYCGLSSDLRIIHSRSLLGQSDHFSFSDPYRLELVNNQFRPNDRTIMLGVTAEYLDGNGHTLGSTCLPVHPNRLITYRENHSIGVVNLADRAKSMQIDIDGGYKLRGQLNIQVDPKVVENVDKLKFTLEKGCS